MKSLKPNQTIVLVTLVVLIVVATIGYSAYQYQTNRKPAPTESVAQIKTERDNAVKALTIHDGVNKVNLDNAQKQTADVQAKLTAVCAQLKTLRAVNVACN